MALFVQMLARNARLHFKDVHAQAHVSTRTPTCIRADTCSCSRKDPRKTVLTQQPCLHWSPFRKKDSYLLPYAPPISDASGWHPCFLTTLRAELWDPEIKTMATTGALFALALPFVAIAYGAAQVLPREKSDQTSPFTLDASILLQNSGSSKSSCTQ